MEKWPNFFIVGADKAGTSSLYSYLNDIPEIFMSRVKEPNYFSISTFPDNHHIKPIRDKTKYLDLFKKVKNEKVFGEASPSYLADPEVPKLIHQVSPEAKILISLRDPVERVFSNFLMLKRMERLTSSFHNEIQNAVSENKNNRKSILGLENSLYYENVKTYLDIFGKEQTKIIIFEEFIEDTKHILEEILNFLNLKVELSNFNPKIYNKYGTTRGPLAKRILQSKSLRRFLEGLISPSKRRLLKEKFLLKEVTKPEMDEKDRIFLVNYYSEDVQKLKKLLEIDLPWKNFSFL